MGKISKKKRDISRELDIALENRAFEIQLFWQRSNYFLVLMTALGIGVFSINSPVFSLIIAIFATITSYYWYKTNLGSKFWQESWEVEVVKLAKKARIRSFERPTEDIVKQVQKSLNSARSKGLDEEQSQPHNSRFRRFIDSQIIKKPSVSHYMISLSLTSMILWAIVSGMYAYQLTGAPTGSDDPQAEEESMGRVLGDSPSKADEIESNQTQTHGDRPQKLISGSREQ